MRLVTEGTKVKNASIVDANGKLLATAEPSLWVNHPPLDPQQLGKLLQSERATDRPAMVVLGTKTTLGVAAPLNVRPNDSGRLLYLEYNITEGRNLVRQTTIYVLALASLASLMAAAISTVLSRSFANPVKLLSQGVRRFGQGELHIRLEENGPLELRHLARATNEMAASLERHIAQSRSEARWRESVESELRIAAQIQEALLPRESPAVPGMEIDARSHAARSVGGDFYDFLDYGPGKLAVAIGDATGKGLPAAILVTECSSVLRSLALTHLPPDFLLAQANELLVSRVGATGRFVTGCVIVLDLASGTLTYSSAGHHPPLLLRVDSGEIQELSSRNGLPLGISRETEYEAHHVRLQPGDTLLLYTDGVTEVQGDSGFYGMDRLKSALGRNLGRSAHQVLDEIERELDAFRGTSVISDDVTILSMRYAPPRVSQDSEPSSLVNH
ncbi:MAG: SpoIIE family protein phosphatase [Candidatus Hydrogenedentes bacterium]|nr:SpoIIE family protein phosphatase [Candidatus Hydrogenedentota bacterium]